MQKETIQSCIPNEIAEPANTGSLTEPCIAETTNVTTQNQDMSQNQLIWITLNKSLKNEIAVAAIMGNMQEESRMCSYRWQGYTLEQSRQLTDIRCVSVGKFICDDLGFGLCQWTAWGRKNNLYNFASEQECSLDDVQMQCEFCLYELQNNYPKTLKHITATDDLNWATEIVRNEYEKAVKDPISLYRRQKYAKEFLELYGESDNEEAA